jgi:hypothetical protein
VVVAFAGAVGHTGFEVFRQQAHGGQRRPHFMGNGGHETRLAVSQFHRPQVSAAGLPNPEQYRQPGGDQHPGHEASREFVVSRKGAVVHERHVRRPRAVSHCGERRAFGVEITAEGLVSADTADGFARHAHPHCQASGQRREVQGFHRANNPVVTPGPPSAGERVGFHEIRLGIRILLEPETGG